MTHVASPGVAAIAGSRARSGGFAPAVRLVLAAVALLAIASAEAAGQVVERVVDGDTIVVRDVGRVRLIGVDTPETVHPGRPVEFFGKEASAFTKRLVDGKRVRLEYDQQRTDRYGRTLAYVHLPDGTFVNAEIIRRGYGHAYTRFPFKYLERFRGLERDARRAGRGLWGSAAPQAPAAAAPPAGAAAALARWDDNRNGRISCAEARRHGIAPVPRGHAAYRHMRDGDNDGVVCE